jgi:hypothetical protein
MSSESLICCAGEWSWEGKKEWVRGFGGRNCAKCEYCREALRRGYDRYREETNWRMEINDSYRG